MKELNKKVFSLCLCIVMLMSTFVIGITASATVVESGTCGDNLTWILDDEGTLTISGKGAMYDYPNYWYVPWYYMKESIKSVNILSGVTHIGRYAFFECINLTNSTISNSVINIEDEAFCKCQSLKNIIIPYGVSNIGDYAFSSCVSLTSITIPDNVTNIGKGAFSGCMSFTRVTIPKNVTNIGEGAFSSCPRLVSINVEKENVNYDSRNNCNAIIETATATLIAGCKNTIIPNTVTSICSGAFSDCTNLTSITIPNSVTNIGISAFSGCVGLTNIEIPVGVLCVDYAVFYACTSLTSITISDGVTSIGGYAFYYCTSLEKIELPYSVKTISCSSFLNCSALDKIYIYNRNCSIDSTAIPYNATIYGFTGSTAETFADENGYYFVAIDDIHEHVYKNDCDSKCNLCGATRTVTHTYGTYTSNGDVTCTKDGTKTAVCTVCEAKNTITDKGSKLPHSDANKDGYCDVCKAVTNADLANPCRNAKINVASAKNVDYKAQVTIKATANGVPTGYSLAMYVNGKQVAKGSNTEVIYTVGQATSDINYTVKVIDAKGNVQKDSTNKDLAKDGGKITVNSSFFAKIIAFFKSLFGSLSKVEVKP